MYVTEENLNQVIGRLLGHWEYGIDTETTGVFWRDRLFSIIISAGDEVFYFNYQHYAGVRPLPRSSIRSLQVLFREGATFFVSNAKFDMRMLRHEGLEIRGSWFCTNAQGRVLKNNLIGGSAYGLASTATRLGLEPKVDAVAEYIAENKLFTVEKIPGKEKTWKNMRFWEVPLEIMQDYAEHDARLHLQAGVRLKTEVLLLKNPSKNQPSQVMENEIKLTSVCHDMEWVGVKVDLDYVAKAQAFEESRILAAKEDFRNLTGGRVFLDSNKALFEAFTECGYDVIPRTEKGNPSFTDDVLADLEGALPDVVRRIRHHGKRISTYYSSFHYHADESSCIHPNMRQGGTETGRFSYSDPNLQNIPKEETPEEGKLDPWYFPDSIVRRSFVPRDEKAFVMIDYSQQEYRMMLDYAGEKKLIAEIMAGADVHQATADLMGIKRQEAKTLNFAILYGAGAEKMSKMLGITVAEAQERKRLYFGKLPLVKRFVNEVIEKGRARGYVMNWAGRRCYIEKREWAYVLPNHLIQGGGADVIKFAMPKVADLLKGTQSKMLLQIHDELLFEFAEEDFHLIPEVQRVMESVYPSLNGMKLTTSAEYSWTSWGHADKTKGLPT